MEGVDLIQKHDFKTWAKYLKEKQNTICGRYPIGILLNVNRYIYFFVKFK